MNDATRIVTGAGSVYELFEAQARSTPEEVAVEHGDRRLTYAELNKRADQLARYLRGQGVGPDELVAVCISRSPEMIVALLGVLKAGGAYVPLDPNYPPERLCYMVENARPRVVLTEAAFSARLATASERILELDAASIPTMVGAASEQKDLGSHRSHLVYVIYTSGSTGRPKGIAMSNAAMVNLLEWHRSVFRRNGDRRRVLQFAALSFDVAFQEIFSTICMGGTLVLLDEWVRKDARALLTLLQERKVERLFLPPLMLQSLAECCVGGATIPKSLHDVIVAGEQLRITPEIVSLFQHLSGCNLHNHYGPTETHVVTALTLSGTSAAWPAYPSIGWPIANTEIHILDEHGVPVPQGTIGEIYIGGAGVARGYNRNAALTAQRFLPDPLSSSPHARMYRTGDLARRNTDGAIDYLGRNDNQVKIRGFRVELGEIEVRLSKHPAVRDAAVVARNESIRGKHLVAYVILREHIDTKELCAHLSASLPVHMVPRAFVTIQKFPLTPNGKLDRNALPPPTSGAYLKHEFEPPSNELEKMLAAIWEELLQVDCVGRNENFFELGGHSLLIVSMLERLRAAGLSVEVSSVYSKPRLSDLAKVISQSKAPRFVAPPRLIPPHCGAITPEMLNLVQLDAEQIERIVTSVPGGAANVQDIYPLAPLQEGILFHHMVDESRGDTYVLPIFFALSSRAGVELLISSLQYVIQRHDVLRTALLWDDLPFPVQVVYRYCALPVCEIVLETHRSAIDQLQERMRPETQRLNLHQAPLMQLWIAPDAGSLKWYAVLQLHHLTSDHDSIETMIAEVLAHAEGRECELPDPMPYRVHVAEALMHAQRCDSQAFFRRKLQDVHEPTAPFGVMDVRGESSRVRQINYSLRADLSARIHMQARRLGVTSATLFHAAWALVAAHTSGRDDVVFGTLLLGRLQAGTHGQRMLGMFINTLPCRINVNAASAEVLVKQTHDELVELLEHEQASLSAAQRCSGIAGSAPLFTSLLNYRHSPAARQAARPLSASGVEVLEVREWSNYPIMLSIDDQGVGFRFELQTDECIDRERLMGYMVTAIESLVEALESRNAAPALSLPVLPAAERQELLCTYNNTQQPVPKKLIHEQFEEQVLRTPDAIAIVHGENTLTYSELNARANQLAAHLRERGIGPDELVGLCVERNVDLVVGLLGVLKAGGAYVPLDPAYPAERLRYMIEDSAPRVLLIHEHLQQKVHAGAGQVVAMDRDWPHIADRSTSNLPRHARARSSQLAYVIYTSGSTGKPKGVMVEQAEVTNFLASMREAPGIVASDRILALTTISFDIAGLEIYLPLVSGACIVLADRAAALDPELLIDLLDSHDISVLQATPATWQMLLGADWKGKKNLRALCGGEGLSSALSTGLRERVSELWNLYGPTETTIWSTVFRVGSAACESSAEPIGRPIANTQIYILDAAGRTVPIGVAGEVHIGGAGVARGYLNRPELTAERFIQDRFSADPAARLYKTGDLGRWRRDGIVEYLGRNDHQVKIRGFRIELGEIEAQLVRYSGVREAIVIAREDAPGERGLTGYVVASTAINVEDVRTSLREALPEYMVPGAIVRLDQLPLTPSGKVDRRALPAPQADAYAQRSYEAPKGDIEEALASIWQGVLRLKQVGRRDNFFDRGGHSVLAMQMMVRVRALFSLRLPISVLFEFPTLEELARQIETLRRQALATDLVSGTSKAAELLERIASMPESTARELVRTLRMEGRS